MSQIFKKSISKNSKGYTLIEMMAVLFIIALISSIVLVNYRRGEKQYILNSQAQALTQFIREAQNMAMGVAILREQFIVPFGYGVAFLRNSNPPYLPILYADLNNNKKYDELNQNEFIRYFDLNPVIKISTITGGGVQQDCLFPSKLYINYSPPDPITEINGVGDDTNCGYGTIWIGLKPKDESLSDRFIEVFETGYINIH